MNKLCTALIIFFNKTAIVKPQSDEFRVLIQVIPRRVSDIMGNSSAMNIRDSKSGGLVNNLSPNKTFSNATYDIQKLGAGFIFDITRQDATFFWGEFCESGFKGFSDKPLVMFFPYDEVAKNNHPDNTEANRQNKNGVEVSLTLIANVG